MADIKPDKLAESLKSLNAKLLPTSGENLPERLERAVAEVGEKVKNIELARKAVINEIVQTEKQAPAIVSQAGGLLAAQAKRQKQIENVLAQGLKEVYLNLAPVQRQEFKRAGEATARKINQLLRQTKINIGKIIKLIKKWLSLIPGVNKYFLEQEAKIKADEIIKMKNETNDK